MADSAETTLGALVELTPGFPFASAGFTAEPDDIRLVRGDNVAQGSLRWANAARWPRTEPVDPKYHLQVGDVVLAMDRPWIEAGLKYAELRSVDVPSYLVQRVARLRAKPGTDQRYIAHIVGSRAFTEYVLAIQTGSAVPHISGPQIASFVLTPHSLEEQRAIAEVLGALDDKIAANTRLAAAADNLATVLFRKTVAGASMGPAAFDTVATIGGGGTPSSKTPEYWDGDVKWASPTDITRLGGPYLFDTSRRITELGLAKCSSRLYPEGSILMTSRATIGAFAIAQTPVAVNQGFIVVVPPDNTLRYWLLHEMRDRVEEFLTHANGATFLELSRGNFRKLQVRLADAGKMESFGQRAAALHSAAAAALRQNLALAATRDAILPALMSGKLRIRDAQNVVSDIC